MQLHLNIKENHLNAWKMGYSLVCSLGLYKEYVMGTPQNGDRRLPKISLEVCVDKTRSSVLVKLS